MTDNERNVSTIWALTVIIVIGVIFGTLGWSPNCQGIANPNGVPLVTKPEK